MILSIFLLLLLALAGLWTILTSSLLNAAIGLAATSAVLTLVLFELNAPMAGVFELSVRAGLITVVFISAISMTSRLNVSDAEKREQLRKRKFFLLPIVMILVGLALFFLPKNEALPLLTQQPAEDVRMVLWNARRPDLLGQLIILLAGIFGVVILFKDRVSSSSKGDKS